MLKVWLTDSLTRAFPLVIGGKAPSTTKTKTRLDLARNEQGSVQLCFWFDGTWQAEVDVTLAIDSKAKAVPQLTVRRVGNVPVPAHNTQTPVHDLDGVGHIPGYVPDVLWPDTAQVAAPMQVHAYWVEAQVPQATRPGVYRAMATLTMQSKATSKGKATNPAVTKTVSFDIHVAKVIAKPRENFPVTHWFYADAICDWYKFDPWEPAFWPMFEKYVYKYVSLGNDTLYVPMFTPPLDGVKRPTQLLDVKRKGKDRYSFDWSNVDQWIRRAKKAGVERFEWTHLFSQWGAGHAIRIYEKKKGQDVLLWPADEPAAGPVYRKFLAQFLPEFKKYLTRRKLMDVSLFHLSDEPHKQHLPAYRTARAILKEHAPWMTVFDALSEVDFVDEVDMPVSVISSVPDFIKVGADCWCYFCCGPRGEYVNRLMDTPLAKVRISGWLFYKLGMKGFLHWGFNYWHECHKRNLIDPFTVSDGLKWPGWAHGDTFVVYPGPQGPLDSIRGRVFAESLQDYALLQTLGISPDDKRLAKLIDFKDFPRQRELTLKLRQQLLKA